MTELKTSHYLKQRSDGRIEPYKPIVNKSDATAGHVLTADGAGGADYAPSIADATGATLGYVFTADGAGNASYQPPSFNINWFLLSSQAASGTQVDFTGIPLIATEIRIDFIAVGTDALNTVSVRLGDSGGFETTGYNAMTTGDSSPVTSQFDLDNGEAATDQRYATVMLSHNGSNSWTANIDCIVTGGSNYRTIGFKTLSDTLTQVRVFGGNFDEGTINLYYR